MGNVSIKQARLRRQGLNSKSYLLETPKGKGVLKVVQNDDPKRIQAMAKVLAFCRKRKAKVPELISTSSNSYIVKFSEGKPFSGSASQLKSIAKELAILHRALAACKVSYPWQPNANLYRHIANPPRHLKKFFDWQKKAQKQFGKDSNHTYLIHYDLQPGNVLFEENHVSVIMDFDAMRKGSPLYELAFAAFRFGLPNKKNVVLFLNTYLKHNKLKGADLERLKYYFVTETLNRISALRRQHPYPPKEMQKFIRFLNIVFKF